MLPSWPFLRALGEATDALTAPPGRGPASLIYRGVRENIILVRQLFLNMNQLKIFTSGITFAAKFCRKG